MSNNIKLKQQDSKYNWSFKVKILRVLWWPFQIFFLKGTGRILSPLRIFLLKLFGAKIDGTTLVMDGVKIWYPWNLHLKNFSTLGKNVEVYNFAYISIGEQTTISQNTFLCSASHDYTKPDMPLIFSEIIIEDQVWIAANSFIGPGVRVTDGCVIGACSVITKDTESWHVYTGNPAIKVKKRELQE